MNSEQVNKLFQREIDEIKGIEIEVSSTTLKPMLIEYLSDLQYASEETIKYFIYEEGLTSKNRNAVHKISDQTNLNVFHLIEDILELEKISSKTPIEQIMLENYKKLVEEQLAWLGSLEKVTALNDDFSIKGRIRLQSALNAFIRTDLDGDLRLKFFATLQSLLSLATPDVIEKMNTAYEIVLIWVSSKKPDIKKTDDFLKWLEYRMEMIKTYIFIYVNSINHNLKT